MTKIVECKSVHYKNSIANPCLWIWAGGRRCSWIVSRPGSLLAAYWQPTGSLLASKLNRLSWLKIILLKTSLFSDKDSINKMILRQLSCKSHQDWIWMLQQCYDLWITLDSYHWRMARFFLVHKGKHFLCEIILPWKQSHKVQLLIHAFSCFA